MTRKEYRPLYKKEQAEFLRARKREDFVEIWDIVRTPVSVAMRKLQERPAKEGGELIEFLYANDGR
jgi:hypothetical protein